MTLQDKFNKTIPFIFQHEGGYINNPLDSGGATNMGITQAVYDSWLNNHPSMTKDVKNITPDVAKQIYYEKYFKLIPEINDLNLPLLQVLFDTAVNFGVSGMIQFIQEAVNLPLTGIYDHNTEVRFTGNNNFDFAVKIINNRKSYRYKRVQENPSQSIFLQGWLNRDEDLRKQIDKLFLGDPIVPILNKLPEGTYPLKQSQSNYMFIDFSDFPPKYYPLSGEKGKRILILDLEKQVGSWCNSNPIFKEKNQLIPTTQSQFIDGKKLVSVAEKWVGKVFSSTLQGQCMAFTRQCLKEAGYPNIGITAHPIDEKIIPKTEDITGRDLANSLDGDDIGQIIQYKEDLLPGDLCFFNNTYGNEPKGVVTHVAIYAGNNNIIHHHSMGNPVSKDDMTMKYGNLFAEGRRLFI